MNQANTKLVDIRARPGLYLVEKSLSALWHFIHGYNMAIQNHQTGDGSILLPADFHDWVAYVLAPQADPECGVLTCS